MVIGLARPARSRGVEPARDRGKCSSSTGVAGAHRVARLGDDHDADRRIDRILDAIAAGAERHRRAADELGVDRGDEAVAVARRSTCRSATCGSRA